MNYQEIRRYAGAELEQMNPTQLLAFTFTWSNELGEDNHPLDLVQQNAVAAHNEMAARWGEDANDNLANYFTASHASYEDMARMAEQNADLLVEIAKGEHDCGAHQNDFSFRSDSHDNNGDAFRRETCRCGRIWGRIGNQYFDPNESTVEEVLASTDRN